MTPLHLLKRRRAADASGIEHAPHFRAATVKIINFVDPGTR